ncbi:MAG: hypothetical protein RL745_408 [Actinomycetota bacterium]
MHCVVAPVFADRAIGFSSSSQQRGSELLSNPRRGSVDRWRNVDQVISGRPSLARNRDLNCECTIDRDEGRVVLPAHHTPIDIVHCQQ